MTDQGNPTARKVDAVHLELRTTLDSVRANIAEMSVDEMSDAIGIVHKYGCEVTGDDDDNGVEAIELTIKAFEQERSKRIAREADHLDVAIFGEGDCWRLAVGVGGNSGYAVDREFATYDEAHAAGAALAEFLRLSGRSYGLEIHRSRPMPSLFGEYMTFPVAGGGMPPMTEGDQ